MQKGNAWDVWNAGIDCLFMEKDTDVAAEETVKQQIVRTSDAFAENMVMLKFIQGLPVIGVLGGCGNPVYYYKVMKYVRIKYQKMYLWERFAINVI